MRKILIIILFLIFNSVILSQDIVYDSVRGNKDYWVRIKSGQNEEKTLSLMYENLGFLTKSKVIASSGILTGMIKGTDYEDYTFPYDTLIFEFNTEKNVNLLIYRYYYNDTTFYYFAGLRICDLGIPTLEGQYLYVTPLINVDSKVNVYNGIGANRELVLTLIPNELNENSLKEYLLTNKVTVQGIKVSRILRTSKTQNYITDINKENTDNVKIWPNPVSTILHIQIIDKKEGIIQIFNMQPKVIYQKQFFSEYLEIDFQNYSSGIYLILISDKNGNILYSTKIIKL